LKSQVHRASGLARWVLGLAVLLAGCGAPPSLEDAQDSPEALAGAVLQAFANGDRSALERLALSESEFRDHVWPALPAARPERNLPFSYVWGDLRQKSGHSLQRSLAEHGGRRYTLTSVRFEGGTTQYGSYRVHRDTVLRVRDERGAEADVRLAGSMLEEDGGWKIFSYVVD
jgi:hypothetical protein